LYGGSLVLSNESELSASEFVTYILVFSQILRPAKAISSSFTGLQNGIVAGERVLQMIDLPIEVTNKENAIKLTKIEREIEFRNVTFKHGDKTILKNLNFKIPFGKMVALVGPSGGGKTTISELIPRFYDPEEGQILIDGIDIKDIDIASLRELLGVVTQESILFNDTIFKNISFSKTEATQEEVERAAKIANAHEFILKTEHGYQTFIGERGLKLSGGQRQRLCIARAVLKNPPIIVLDEATSALDTESEKLVQDALDNLMQNRTSLVIAHRLSTIQKADLILVIKDGEVVEQGTHLSLISTENGLYKKLQLMQSV
jgi:subfamily B ATP-binding cassette protein MsbA